MSPPESPKPVASKISEEQREAPTLNCQKVSRETWPPCEALLKGQRALPRYNLASPMAFPFTEKWVPDMQAEQARGALAGEGSMPVTDRCYQPGRDLPTGYSGDHSQGSGRLRLSGPGQEDESRSSCESSERSLLPFPSFLAGHVVSPAAVMSASQSRAQVSAARNWPSQHEKKVMHSGEETVLAGALNTQLNTSTRKWGFGLLGWENPGGNVCISRKLSQPDPIS